jgi:hypothetical protein
MLLCNLQYDFFCFLEMGNLTVEIYFSLLHNEGSFITLPTVGNFPFKYVKMNKFSYEWY